MKPTIYEVIRKFLNKKSWTYGGVIEDHVRAKLGTKGTTTSRRLREMAEDKSLDSRVIKFESRWVVQYKLVK